MFEWNAGLRGARDTPESREIDRRAIPEDSCRLQLNTTDDSVQERCSSLCDDEVDKRQDSGRSTFYVCEKCI